MGRIHASLGRIGIFSFLLIGVLVFLMQDASAISADKHKGLIARSLPTPTAFPTPTSTPTPTPTDTPTPTPLPMPQGYLLHSSGAEAPTATVSPTRASVVANASDDSVWERLADCESHQHWTDDTGNGYYGGLQFSLGAWQGVGGVGKPSDASRDEQITRGKMLQAARGWAPWGACGRMLGLH